MNYSKLLPRNSRTLNAIKYAVEVMDKDTFDNMTDEEVFTLVSGVDRDGLLKELANVVEQEPLADGKVLETDSQGQFDMAKTAEAVDHIIGEVAKEARSVTRGENHESNVKTVAKHTLENLIRTHRKDIDADDPKALQMAVEDGLTHVEAMLRKETGRSLDNTVLFHRLSAVGIPNTDACYCIAHEGEKTLRDAITQFASHGESVEKGLREINMFLNGETPNVTNEDISATRSITREEAQFFMTGVAQELLPYNAVQGFRALPNMSAVGMAPLFTHNYHRETGDGLYTLFIESIGSVGEAYPTACRVIAEAIARYCGLPEDLGLTPAVLYKASQLPSEFTVRAICNDMYAIQATHEPESDRLLLIGDMKSAAGVIGKIYGSAFDEDRHTLGEMERTLPNCFALVRYLTYIAAEIEGIGTAINVHQ